MPTFKNFSFSHVAVAPSPAVSGLSLEVEAGQGARFPAVPFKATVWAAGAIPLATNGEIINVTNRVGDVLTIERAAESSTARTIEVGDQIAATLTQAILEDIFTRLLALEAGSGGTVQNIRKVTISGAFSNFQTRNFTISPALTEFNNAVITYASETGGTVRFNITSNTNLEAENLVDVTFTADGVVHIVEFNVEP